jgi:hypothetical protein
MEADFDKSFLALKGAPCGGKSGGERMGVATLEVGFEDVLLPERWPEEELDAELRDWFGLRPVVVLATILLDGGALGVAPAGLALVKVSV